MWHLFPLGFWVLLRVFEPVVVEEGDERFVVGVVGFATHIPEHQDRDGSQVVGADEAGGEERHEQAGDDTVFTKHICVAVPEAAGDVFHQDEHAGERVVGEVEKDPGDASGFVVVRSCHIQEILVRRSLLDCDGFRAGGTDGRVFLLNGVPQVGH